MNRIVTIVLVLAFGALSFSARFAAGADGAAKPKISYQEHVLPILRNRCASCHNADKQKGGLTLDNYGAAMQGGGSGKVIEPGDADGSTLWKAINHTEEPFMPPKTPKIPDTELAVIKQWIEAGAPENSGSVVAMTKKPKFEFKLDPSSLGKPQGTPAMPEQLLTQPAIESARPNAVLALASSPWAPVVAIAGHKQVLLYHTSTFHLLGVLPFPEGTIHVLKFSRNGSLLLAAGGRGGQSGRGVVWDLKTGKRVFEVGKEYDAVLAADISPDHGLVALGGPNRVVRVYNTADETVVYEEKKHTEWITTLEFSPDGVLLASGDRNGGLFVWEAATGREFHELRGHSAAISEVSWRLDSNVLASSSEDSTVRLWEMENGGNIKTWGAHGGGSASVRFAKDGRLTTAGRDRVCRVWDQNGGKQREFEPFGDLALKSVFTFNDSAIIAADFAGEVRVFELKEGKRIGNLVANPARIETRLAQAQQASAAAKAAADALARELETLKQAAIAGAQKATVEEASFKQALELSAKTTADRANLVRDLKAKTDLEGKASEALKIAQDELAKARSAATDSAKLTAQKAQVVQTADAAVKAAKTANDQAELAKNKAADAIMATATAIKGAKTKAEADKAALPLPDQTKAAVAAVATLEQATAKLGLANVDMNKFKAEHAVVAKASDAAAVLAAKADDRFQLAKAASEKVSADKVNLARLTTEAQTRQQAAVAALAVRKAEFDKATAAKVAAAKSLADKTPTAQALIAKAAALQTEADLLAAEKKAFDSASPAVANAQKAQAIPKSASN